jgi:diguanylate cyclase (GGDEF)-like protein
MDRDDAVPEKFAELLEREELRRARTGEVLTVAVLDVDGLGAINVEHGDEAGDAVLQACADALHATLRSVDVVARTGADEYSVLLHATGSVGAEGWAERFGAAFDVATAGLGTPSTSCALGLGSTSETVSLMEAAARARRRMAAIQEVRRVLRERFSEER